MEAAFSLMSSSPFTSLAVTSSALTSVMDSLLVSSSQKPSDTLSLEESVFSGTLQNTDHDTNLFKKTLIPPPLSTSDSASNELSSSAEINSLSQELILTAMDTITPTSSSEYLNLSDTMELMSLDSEFSITNGEVNITPSSFSELNFGSMSGDESTTITSANSFSSGKNILPEASTLVSNAVLEETPSSISSPVEYVSESVSQRTTSTSLSLAFGEEPTTMPSLSSHLELSPQNAATFVQPTTDSPQPPFLPEQLGNRTMSEKPLNTGSTMETSISSIQDFQTSLSHGISSISSSPANTITSFTRRGDTHYDSVVK